MYFILLLVCYVLTGLKTKYVIYAIMYNIIHCLARIVFAVLVIIPTRHYVNTYYELLITAHIVSLMVCLMEMGEGEVNVGGE